MMHVLGSSIDKPVTDQKSAVNNESTAGADASVEALKLYHMLSLCSAIALV